jgi:hypothetical protein
MRQEKLLHLISLEHIHIQTVGVGDIHAVVLHVNTNLCCLRSDLMFSVIVYSFCFHSACLALSSHLYLIVKNDLIFTTSAHRELLATYSAECCISQVHYSFCPVLNNFAISMYA